MGTPSKSVYIKDYVCAFYKGRNGNNMANKNSQVEDVREILSVWYIKFRFDI